MRGRAPHFIQIHADILAKSWTGARVLYRNMLIYIAIYVIARSKCALRWREQKRFKVFVATGRSFA
jgi:hypothetical protein